MNYSYCVFLPLFIMSLLSSMYIGPSWDSYTLGHEATSSVVPILVLVGQVNSLPLVLCTYVSDSRTLHSLPLEMKTRLTKRKWSLYSSCQQSSHPSTLHLSILYPLILVFLINCVSNVALTTRCGSRDGFRTRVLKFGKKKRLYCKFRCLKRDM